MNWGSRPSERQRPSQESSSKRAREEQRTGGRAERGTLQGGAGTDSYLAGKLYGEAFDNCWSGGETCYSKRAGNEALMSQHSNNHTSEAVTVLYSA